MFDLIIGIFVFIPAIVGCIALYRYMTRYENKIEQQIRADVAVNGGTYWRGLAHEVGLKSFLLNSDLDTYIRHGISYPDGTRLGQANFSQALGTGSQRVTAFNFACIPLNKYSGLWLVVDSRKNNPLGASLMDAASVSLHFEPLNLEGNFNATFKVYVASGQQVEALTVLNPASMEKLQSYFDTYDMEICDGVLFIYTNTLQAFYTPQTRMQMTHDVMALAHILGS